MECFFALARFFPTPHFAFRFSHFTTTARQKFLVTHCSGFGRRFSCSQQAIRIYTTSKKSLEWFLCIACLLLSDKRTKYWKYNNQSNQSFLKYDWFVNWLRYKYDFLNTYFYNLYTKYSKKVNRKKMIPQCKNMWKLFKVSSTSEFFSTYKYISK